ncbi:MAG: tRNA-dihydrouridine synthase [Rhodopseudomonas palustris]|nr:tRNA-dihydrouridine synthase [Rhodopseudomonas palustris]
MALQLGGSIRAILATSARIGEQYGYDEINLNVGCPSIGCRTAGSARCLMAEPELVAECVAAMKQAVGVPVTVKCRIGMDDQDPRTGARPAGAGSGGRGGRCLDRARPQGLAAGAVAQAQGRDIPPLDYDRVYRLKAALPKLPIVINGGITSIAEAKAHLAHVDGVMQGRAAYQEPWRLLAVDPGADWRSGAPSQYEGGAGGARTLYRRAIGARPAAARHHPPSGRSVPGGAGRAGVPSPAGRAGRQARKPASRCCARRWRWLPITPIRWRRSRRHSVFRAKWISVSVKRTRQESCCASVLMLRD